jgi:hypothetical protein
MLTTFFYVLLLLTSFAFVFAVLAALYDARRAYLSLAWAPPALYAVVLALRHLSEYAGSRIRWDEILLAVAWAGLAQCALGFALAAVVARRGEGRAGLLLASCLAGLPYLFRV